MIDDVPVRAFFFGAHIALFGFECHPRCDHGLLGFGQSDGRNRDRLPIRFALLDDAFQLLFCGLLFYLSNVVIVVAGSLTARVVSK